MQLLLVFQSVFHFGKVKVFAGAASEYVQDVQASSLEVRCRIVRLGDEELAGRAVLSGLENVADLDELLLDGAQKGQTGLDFRLGVLCLHRG